MTLDKLLRAAECADGLTRIDFRDPIAAYGPRAIEKLRPWLADPRLGSFAVRTIAQAGRHPGAAEAARLALGAAASHAPASVARDIRDALTGLAQNRARAPMATTGGSASRGLAELRAVVEEWHRRGRPKQPGIPWPRERWLAELPGHRKVLKALPASLDRAAVAAVARHAADGDEAAISALVAVLAWGHGRTGYAQFRARDILERRDVGPRLRQVAETAQSRGALAGYGRLAAESRIEGLGPSFGTKFL